MSQTATKVFYNRDNVLVKQTTLQDGIIDIKRNPASYEVYTMFDPCCGSYTARIDQYSFSAQDTAKFQKSISFIGLSYYGFKGMVDFSTEKTVTIKNPSIYAMPIDFKGTSAYFRKRDKEIRGILRTNEKVELIKVEGLIKVGVLGKTTFKEEDYLLIITEPLNKLPNMPESLYEWSQGNGRRLVGWVKANEVE